MPTPVEQLTPEVLKIKTLETRIASLQGSLKDANSWARQKDQQLVTMQDSFDALAAIKEEVEYAPIIPVPRKGAPPAGVVFVQLSDWHVAEIVDKQVCGGLNSYSPEIARKRSRTCGESAIKLWRHTRRSYEIDTMVLFLGGDFITGYLHEELAQTNAMGPVQEAQFAKELLIPVLELFIAEKSIKKLRIVCMRGNHGRSSKKVQFKNDYATSFESFIYWDLQSRYHDGKRVIVEVPKGDVHVISILPDYRLRMYHGHQFKYSDGVGGLTIPLNKWQDKQQKIKRAEFNLHGHYHQYCLPNPYTIQAGALKGFDEYSASKGFAFQEPYQTFALLDTRRKIIAQPFPIFCT